MFQFYQLLSDFNGAVVCGFLVLIQMVSISFSLLSSCWSFVIQHRSLRLSRPDKENITPSGALMQVGFFVIQLKIVIFMKIQINGDATFYNVISVIVADFHSIFTIYMFCVLHIEVSILDIGLICNTFYDIHSAHCCLTGNLPTNCFKIKFT